jgi:hypothetical protein
MLSHGLFEVEQAAFEGARCELENFLGRDDPRSQF